MYEIIPSLVFSTVFIQQFRIIILINIIWVNLCFNYRIIKIKLLFNV